MGDNPEIAASGAEKQDLKRPDPVLTASNDGKLSSDAPPHPEVPRPVQSLQSFRSQTFASFPSGTGHNSSSHGPRGESAEGEEAPEEIPWGPSHPCFPHMNVHVPVDSADYANTRIIRIRRNWMVKGDAAPTFSNLYPEILDPLLPEQEFRSIISKLNDQLIAAFDPAGLRNWVDNVVGILTGWIWDDLGANSTKSQLINLEKWLESWNQDVGASEGVKIWPLRSTGYMSLDIQIPDPKVRIVDSEPGSPAGSRPSSAGGQ